MDLTNFKIEIKKMLKDNEIELNENQIEKFYKYMSNLKEWNEKINLTAIKEDKEIILKHFIDSLKISEYLNNNKILDIGSGAGFPGIPLKIKNDKLEITLIDSINKKINFIKDTINKLELKNIEAIHIRAEELAQEKEYREQFDTVVSRAVANLTTLVEYMIPFVKINGICICMKGPNFEKELEDAKYAIEKLGGEIEKIINYRINEENERNIVIIRKKKHTEQTYPRKQGKPLKEPLLKK